MRPQDSVGMRRGVEITLAPSHPLWPAEYERVRAELMGALPELAKRYGALKRRLAADVGTRRLDYLNGKTEFILGVLRSEGFVPPSDYPIHYG